MHGMIILFKLNIPVNFPIMNPETLFISAFNPIGAADKKSSNMPEIKPADEPIMDEFMKETYTITRRTRSGIAGSKTSLERIVASRRERKRVVMLVQTSTFAITFLLQTVH
jgi:hypothetical protein